MAPSIPAVLRVMTGWFGTGIGALNLAVELDGGLTPPYVAFHVALICAGLLLLSRHRLGASRAGALVVAGGMWAGAPYPYPPVKWLVVDLIFWGCVALILAAVAGAVEQRLPERRTPVDMSGWPGHAEPRAVAATPERTGENVGGLT